MSPLCFLALPPISPTSVSDNEIVDDTTPVKTNLDYPPESEDEKTELATAVSTW